MRRRICISLVLLVCMIYLMACRKQLEKPQWDTEILVPLLKTSLGIQHILADTSYQLAADSSIVLVYKEQLDSFALDVLDTFSVQPFYTRFGLSSIKFSDNTIVRTITMGQLARQMTQSKDTAAALAGIIILSNQGNTITLKPMDGLSAGPFAVDVTQWFQSAELQSGYLEIKITNNLPVSLNEARFQLNNKNLLPSLIADVDFKNITPGSTQSQQIDLAQKILEGNLLATAPLINIGGGKIVIDTNAAVQMEISIHNIKFSKATAYFPAQEVIRDQEEVSLTGLKGGMELKKARFKSAAVRIQIYSTVADSLYFSYQLPNAVAAGGQSFAIEGVVAAGNSKDGLAFDKSYDFSGYTLDLSGKPGHQIVNAFYSDLTASIKNSSRAVTLSFQDSLAIRVTMSNIHPDYILGYLQSDTVLKGEVPFDLFKTLQVANLNFDQVNVSLSVKNGFGITGTITTDFISSGNNKGQSIALVDNTLIGVARPVAAATDHPFQEQETILSTGKASNLLSISPNFFSYQFKIHAGTTGGPKQYTDFAYGFSALKPALNISVPLSLQANQMVLADTILVSPEFSASIKKGSLTIIAANGFPVQASLSLLFLDAFGNTTDSLISPDYIKEARMDGTALKVKNKEISKIKYTFNEVKLTHVKEAKKIIFKVIADTRPAGIPVKIYQDYSIDFKVVGDLTYRIE